MSGSSKPATSEYKPIQLRIVDGSLYANDSNDDTFHHLGRIRGESGVDGRDGVDGEQGERGLQGIHGEGGIQGLTGDKGKSGVDGEHGINGAKGDPGQRGLPGVSMVGARGHQGLSGKDGKAGKPGLRGKDGSKGIQGLAGEVGKDGKIGINGAAPDHEIDIPGSRFRFLKPNGEWGEWIRIPRSGGGGADDWFYKRVSKDWRFNVVNNRLYAQHKVNGVWKNEGFFG